MISIVIDREYVLLAIFRESEDTALLMLKEIYARMGIAVQKPRPEPVPSNQSTPVFPRHPMSSAAAYSNTFSATQSDSSISSYAVPQADLGPQHMSVTSSQQQAVFYTPGDARPPAVGSPYPVQPSPVAAMGASAIIGPPPMCGFVRK